MPAVSSKRFTHRRDQIRRRCKPLGVDGFLIANPINVAYLTGFSGDSSVLFVDRRSDLLLSDTRFTQQIEEECPGLAAEIRRTPKQMPDFIADLATKAGYRTLAFESTYLTVAALDELREKLPAVEFRPTKGEVENHRAVKDADEVLQIRGAIGIAERAFALFRVSLRPTDDEKSLHDSMESYVRRAGGVAAAFPTIVGVGPRAALPHAVPTLRRVEESDFVLVDWGARGRFYHSDLTRVLATRKISRKLQRVYEVVLRAQLAAIAAVRPGIACKEVDRAARSVIEEAGFGGNFGHGLGHGVGLQIHEAPSLSPDKDDPLKAGMVVTIEPGIYLPGWGGVRIEDDILVTKEGCEVLTSVPKQLDELVVDW